MSAKNPDTVREALAGIPEKWLLPHPVLPLPSRQQVVAWLALGEPGRAHLENALRDRAELMELERTDPLRHGFEPETYATARRLLEQYDELIAFAEKSMKAKKRKRTL